MTLCIFVLVMSQGMSTTPTDHEALGLLLMFNMARELNIRRRLLVENYSMKLW
jgi:hypothetical protein